MPPDKSTVAYCRISADKTGAGLGVERQAADCRDLAERLGLPAPEIVTDNDLSAYSGKRRPGYEQLLAGLREGRWTHLLVWHVDRLCRSVRDLEDIVDLVNGRVAVHTVKGGEIDLETPEGRLQARMLGTLARYESEHRSDRVRRKLDEVAAAGRSHGGPRRYGYTADGAVIPSEAGVVAELVRRIVGGESIRSLAAELRARGVPSPGGAAWAANTVRKLVVRPRNAGLREHRGEIVGEAAWPPIVDRDSWEACRALLSDPARRTSPGNAPARLLSGIAVCQTCGGPVRSGGVKHGLAVYRCATGSHVKRQVVVVDRLVEAYLLPLLEREGVPMTKAAAPAGDDHGKADAVRLRIEQLEDKYSDGDLSRAAYLRNRDRLAGKLAELERAEALTRVPGVLEGVTPGSWATLPLEKRRAAVDYLVRVVIWPLRGSEFPDGVEIIPKRRTA